VLKFGLPVTGIALLWLPVRIAGVIPPKKRFGDPQLDVKTASQPDWPFFMDTNKDRWISRLTL